MSYYGYRGGSTGRVSVTGSQSGSVSGSASIPGSESDCQDTESSSTGSSSTGPVLPYPGFAEVALKYLTQDTRPRNWCLMLITNPWFERVSMLVILLNCVTLGMYQPCVDDQCITNRCKILQMFDDIIFAFFSLEMTIKMVAMGVYGKSTYLADSWNRLDFFIVLAGALEYCLNVENMNLSAIRTIRVLRPLRAINRIPSMRILVMLLLDTLPMLGNVLLLCFFVFFIFGIVGVQLWEGILRQRCALSLPDYIVYPNISMYYEFSKEQDYICTTAEDNGMHQCGNFPPYRYGPLICNETAVPFSLNIPTNTSCVNWNQYYTNCTQRGSNPFQGTISFDNIGLAWVAIFLVISLEGWTDIMYYVQDAHSFWDWIYFVLLIVIGSFFMINLCLVVIATQFAETKKREMERMRQERARFTSTSTLASSTNNSEPATCYAEIVKYIAHLWRRFNRRMAKKIRLYKYRREQQRDARNGETLALSGKPRQHHPSCPKLKMMCQPQQAPIETECIEEPPSPRPLLRAASLCAPDSDNASGLALLSPPSLGRRRSSVMFSDVVVLHGSECGGSSSTGTQSGVPLTSMGPVTTVTSIGEKNICSSEKMTQTGDGNIWQTNANPPRMNADLGLGDAMTCQELLALSGALSAALPTGQMALDSFFDSLTKGITKRNSSNITPNAVPCDTQLTLPTSQLMIDEDFSCCGDLLLCEANLTQKKEKKKRSRFTKVLIRTCKIICAVLSCMRQWIKKLVDHKYFQQGILLAILINTLSMGIEYHNQPEELTIIVEISNVVFSAIFAVEMLLKVIAEGPFGYIANGFNVFDGVIVVLSAFELAQNYLGDKEVAGSSGLSVLRTFRLLRILKLVRFMPNLRRQLFVMLRTMDNVAVFFSLLVLFIFIFSILGMNLFGCKFCDRSRDDPDVECDRKNFDTLLWAIVTVFQILTQEDWNVVLFNGMEKTSHWAALYFVALMTFGNYVLFNLLVAILVEGFSSERNERREREQRELAKSKLSAEVFSDNNELPYDESRSISDSSDSFTQQNEIKNQWRSADDVRKVKDSNGQRLQQVQRNKGKTSHKCSLSRRTRPEDTKCNIQKESMMLQQGGQLPQLPIITTTAATPQDSPNTTLEPGASFREFNYNYSLSRSSLLDSLDSIDRSSSASIPGLLKPPNSFTLTLSSATRARNVTATIKNEKDKQSSGDIKSSNGQDRLAIPKPALSGSIEKLDHLLSNYSPTQYEKNIQLTKGSLQKDILIPSHNSMVNTSDKSSLLNEKKQLSNSEELNGNKCKIQRGYSWKLSRPSLRRKNSNVKNRSGSDSDAVIILNNGRDHPNMGSTLQLDVRKNDLLLQSTNRIQNDTHGDTPNNKSVKGLSPQNSFKGVSPQNSVRSRASTYSTLPQVTWSGSTPQTQTIQQQKSNNPVKSLQPSHLNQHSSSQRFIHQRFSLTPDLLSNCQTSVIDNNNEKLRKEPKVQASTNQQQIISMSPPKSSNILISNLSPPEKTDNSSACPLPNIKQIKDDFNQANNQNNNSNNGTLTTSLTQHRSSNNKLKDLFRFLEPKGCLKERDEFSLYVFSSQNKFRQLCTWIVERKWFDNVILLFIALNCITLAMERPNIPPNSTERAFLATANYVFTGVFALEMFIKVVATGMFYGPDAYFTSGWNIMDGSLVIISIIDLLMSLISESSPRIFGILRVFRLLRSLRPLRVINRAPGLKLVVQTLLSSLRPIGNIVLICCTFFIIFGILGVQLFKGAFYYCEGENIKGVKNKTDCLAIKDNVWVNRKYNFDDLGKALMSLFVLSSRDGWVNIMYTGLDAVGVDQQPIVNYSEWRLLYFIAFILLVGFFVLNMFVGVVVENFHRCREEQEKEERVRRAAKRALQMEKKRRKMHEPPYYSNYSQGRLFVHNVVTSKYFDLAIAGVIGLNVVTMAIEYYKMPAALEYALKIFNYFFTAVFILEAIMKLVALGFKIYLKDKWNQLDVIIVILSIVGIVLEELQTNIIPINPTIMRVMRVLRIARVLKLLKMAKGIRALLDTVMQALPQVGNLGLLFFLLFFIFAALGVELFGRLECSEDIPCQGLGEHAHFANFGMAFLTLFRVATGDNWNGIMKDTLRENCDSSVDCVRNCCVSTVIAPIFFVIFVLMAQFVLVNVVVAVLMKHLEESHKQMEDEMDMEVELERELEREQEDQEDQALCMALELESATARPIRPLKKVSSLPADFVYSAPSGRNSIQLYGGSPLVPRGALRRLQYHGTRRQTLHAPRLSAAFVARSFDHSRGFLSREASTDSYHARRRLSREPSTESYQIKRLLTRESSTESYATRRHHLTRDSSIDSYQTRRQRKRMDSITSDMMQDKSASTSNVLYEEEPCFIDEDEEKSTLRTALVHDTREPTESKQSKVQTLNNGQKEMEDNNVQLKRDGSLYKKKYKNPDGEETCLLKPDINTLDPEKPKQTQSYLNVPKNTRPSHKMYGSTKHLFKQAAIDNEGFEESSLLLPPMTDSKIDKALPFLKVEIASEYIPPAGKSLNIPAPPNTLDLNSQRTTPSTSQVHIEIQSQSPTEPSAAMLSLSEISSNKQMSPPNIIAESDFNTREMSEEESIRKVIAERRKIDLMKPDYTTNLPTSSSQGTTQVHIESCQVPKETHSSLTPSQSIRPKYDRHLSADRMSAANFSTSGESGEFLLGQRSSESYEETSDEQGLTINSASTAIVEKTNSINDVDDLDCLITVPCDDKDVIINEEINKNG